MRESSRLFRPGVRPLDELLRHLQSLRKPFILGHESADPDAVASAYGLSTLLDAPMGFPSLSREGKLLLEQLGCAYELFPDLSGFDVVVVDTNRKEMLGGLDLSRASTITVVDHHSTPPTLAGNLFIFPDFSSTSEIVARLFGVAGLEPDEKIRDALVVGIYYDTKGLSLARGRTLEVVSGLLGDRVLSSIVSVINKPRDISERIARLKGLRKGKIIRYGDVLITMVDAGSFESSVASILITAGADVSIAFGKEKRVARLSLRASQRVLEWGLDLGRLVEDLDCGGHPGAVGCHCSPEECERVAEVVKERVLEVLRKIQGPQILREY